MRLAARMHIIIIASYNSIRVRIETGFIETPNQYSVVDHSTQRDDFARVLSPVSNFSVCVVYILYAYKPYDVYAHTPGAHNSYHIIDDMYTTVHI